MLIIHKKEKHFGTFHFIVFYQFRGKHVLKFLRSQIFLLCIVCDAFVMHGGSRLIN